jgi:hypothetical protein
MTKHEERHERAVQQTYAWAREAAERGEYDEAIAWMGTLEAVEGELRPDWEAQRASWFDRTRDPADGTVDGD